MTSNIWNTSNGYLQSRAERNKTGKTTEAKFDCQMTAAGLTTASAHAPGDSWGDLVNGDRLAYSTNRLFAVYVDVKSSTGISKNSWQNFRQDGYYAIWDHKIGTFWFVEQTTIRTYGNKIPDEKTKGVLPSGDDGWYFKTIRKKIHFDDMIEILKQTT